MIKSYIKNHLERRVLEERNKTETKVKTEGIKQEGSQVGSHSRLDNGDDSDDDDDEDDDDYDPDDSDSSDVEGGANDDNDDDGDNAKNNSGSDTSEDDGSSADDDSDGSDEDSDDGWASDDSGDLHVVKLNDCSTAGASGEGGRAKRKASEIALAATVKELNAKKKK